MCHVSQCNMSLVTCHLSRVTCHVSPVTCQTKNDNFYKQKIKCYFFILKKKDLNLVELDGGGSVNNGASPSSFGNCLVHSKNSLSSVKPNLVWNMVTISCFLPQLFPVSRAWVLPTDSPSLLGRSSIVT